MIWTRGGWPRPEGRGSNRSTNPYETITLLHEYLLMHYALPSTLLTHTDVPDIPWFAMHFPAECARECIAAATGIPIGYISVWTRD